MSAPPTPRPPGLLLRLAAMTYEAVLLFGVVFIVGYLVLALAQWTYPLQPHQRWTLQAVLFVAIGVYFVWCWSRGGQTLAMKTWRLRVVGPDGGPLSWRTAVLRYLLAWHLFAPGIAYVALFQAHAAWDIAAFAVGFVAMLAVGIAGRDRQLLHDRWLGTRVIRE
ncbi:MAG: RDD family protein [Pseudomonadota bacterium]